jgi:serine protease Do
VSIDGYDEKGQIRWTGSGFLVAADGKVLTNYHVIRNSKQATVRLANGDAYDSVKVMDIDRRKDIALLKIKAVDLQPIRIGSSNSLSNWRSSVLLE